MNRDIAKQELDTLIAEICKEKGLALDHFMLDHNLNLLESGICDSLGLLQLVASLEERLGIEIDLSEQDPEEFTNYDKLVDIISAA